MPSLQKREVADLYARICTGLADPKRIRILHMLAERPDRVTSLAERLNIPQPTASRHLKVLRESGLVHSKREGTAVVYMLADARITKLLDMLSSILTDMMKEQVVLSGLVTAQNKAIPENTLNRTV